MPLPTSINDLSIVASSNSPAGSESPSLLDDYQRTHASYIAQLRDASHIASSSNVKMTIAAASTTATLTADEVIVGTAIGGNTSRLANFSKSVNLATTGAGGMDSGAAPVLGYVALYAIYNVTTATSALMAVNATSAAAPLTYTGGSMPSGYTMSALLAVVPTNASSQFKVCTVRDRKVGIPLGTFFSFAANIPAQDISLASFIPFNAKEVWGELSVSCNATANASISVNGGTAATQSQQTLSTFIGSVSAVFIINFGNVLLNTAQTIGIGANTTAGTPSFSYYVGGYAI